MFPPASPIADATRPLFQLSFDGITLVAVQTSMLAGSGSVEAARAGAAPREGARVVHRYSIFAITSPAAPAA